MRSRCWRHLGALSILAFAWGCAEEVKDIDRTQGNLIRKADLEGEWYLLQTVVGVPPTSAFTFEGETSRMERVRFALHEDYLVAYRSYPLVPGARAPSSGVPFDGIENPVAAYPIRAHVDIIREYNASTGEQSNVIVENTSDRLWHDREYVRVDWSASLVTNFDFIAPVKQQVALAYFVPEEQGGPDAVYREADAAGALRYFDVTGKVFVEPDLWGCIFSWYGLAAEDCTSAEIKVRTSFGRVAPSTYQPFHYDDQLMSRFGYFRTEFFTYDEQRGVTDTGRRLLINRHHIFEASADAEGKPIPLPERTVRSVPYYLAANFPEDPLLLAAARSSVAQWSEALKAGLVAAMGRSDVADPFVLCRNPVAEDDPAACGAPGFSPRMGDLRYSTLHWVDPETVYGLLGYGPAAVDPVTGEAISGKAYVYGAAVSTYASQAVDMVRYYNEELDFAALVHGAHYAEEVRARLDQTLAPPAPAAALEGRSLDRPLSPRGRPARPEARRDQLKPYDAGRVEQRIEAAIAQGKGPLVAHAEVKAALARRHGGVDFDALPADLQARLEPARILNPVALKRQQARRKAAMARSADLADMMQPDLAGIVRAYAGRTDYEQVWREIRAEIFGAVAEHELGHALGLRHNFQGSYDSLNYSDEYWRLREENLIQANTLADIYRLSAQTENQRDGQMRQRQYSSIMDYGYGWANDLQGIGKYDAAALVFGYTSDYYAATGARCARYESTPDGARCLAKQPGYLPVFKKRLGALGDAGRLLTGTELGFTYDDPGLPSVTLLERYHYTTLARSFPQRADFLEAGREFMSYADFLDAKGEADRPVRVPFMFCSDEWEGGLLSCHAWDQGADPFELTRSKVEEYRATYPFVNFRRDRPWFDIWDPLFNYFFRTFLPLSDIFQSWYVAPWGKDPLFDRSYDLAIHTGFSLLGEVLATPAYGQYCDTEDGRLIHISDEPVLQGNEYIDPDCPDGSRRVLVPPGEGRRRFSGYDAQAGYYFEYKPQEAGHYWATLAAVWALVDPEAYVVGVEGDAGTYAISFYDWFGDELDALSNRVLTKNYAAFSPRGAPVEGDDGQWRTSLKHLPAAPLYDRDAGGFFNAETGEAVSADPGAGPLAGPTGLCEACTRDNDCAGHTGFLEGTFCQPLEDGALVCLQDCSEDDDLCPSGTVCDARGNCVPPAGTAASCAALAGACSVELPLGRCPADATCVDGACVAYPWAPIIETEPTFALASDILFYGFLFTTAGFSTRFNDQLNVFRPGSPNAVEPDLAVSEVVRFTNPETGITYAAAQPRCASDGVQGGHLGRCAPCFGDAQCAGHTGSLGGSYCQPIGDDAVNYYCLQDCTEDPGLCGADEVCDDRGNCVPEAGACGPPAPCSPAEPLGSCAEGSTCVAGACQVVFAPGPHCQLLRPDDTGAVQLVKRGQQLAERYQASLDAWYRYDGPDEAEDNRLARRYFADRFQLRSLVDLLETVQATYALFGRIY